MITLFTAAKNTLCMLKDPFNEQIIVHNSYYALSTSVQCHIALLKNGKHSTVLCM